MFLLSTAAGDTLQLVMTFILFFVILFGAYYLSRSLGNVYQNRTKSSNMRIIETLAISPNKYLHLVKVGEQVFLIAVTKESVEYLCEIEATALQLPEIKGNGDEAVFHRTLMKLLDRDKANKKQVGETSYDKPKDIDKKGDK